MNELGNISIRALLIFIDVYETQNFSVVARREGISASQVSRVIHQMEDVLGQQLLPQYPGDNPDGKRAIFYPLCASDDWQHGGARRNSTRER